MKKYVLVTASSKGLGLEIAKQLSFSGYNIILTSRSNKNLKYARSLLNPSIEHEIVKIDFSKDDVQKQLIEKIKKFNIHSIVHNYGINFENDQHPIETEILDKSIYNNFTVAVEINNLLVDKLTGNPSKIIYIGSTASLHSKASPSYTLSKSLINTYVKNISNIYIKNNIMICAVLPGILAHENSVWDKKKITDTKRYDQLKQQQPLERFSMPEDIATYIVDLVNQKSLMFSGSIMKLDANDY